MFHHCGAEDAHVAQLRVGDEFVDNNWKYAF